MPPARELGSQPIASASLVFAHSRLRLLADNPDARRRRPDPGSRQRRQRRTELTGSLASESSRRLGLLGENLRRSSGEAVVCVRCIPACASRPHRLPATGSHSSAARLWQSGGTYTEGLRFHVRYRFPVLSLFLSRADPHVSICVIRDRQSSSTTSSLLCSPLPSSRGDDRHAEVPAHTGYPIEPHDLLLCR